jgi:hypothetical protein
VTFKVPSTLTFVSVVAGEVLTINLSFKLVSPPTFKFLPTPTPPEITTAPVVVPFDWSSS